MSPTTVVLTIAAVTAFPVLLWAIGRTVTVMGEHAPYTRERKQYLAGRLSGVRITALIDGDDELLVSLTASATDKCQAINGPLARVFRVTASECSLDRVRRWRDEGTLLRAYLSEDGALVLVDPVLGGNAACDPATTFSDSATTHSQL
jgi:hypothetical protein